MNTGNARGYILDRTIFDRMIAEKAGKEGTEILTGVDVVGLSPFENGYRIVSLKDAEKKWDVQARVVIAADGVESRAGRWAGITTHCNPRDMECCAQVVMAGIDIDPHAFSLYFTGEFAPEGYAWVFPKGDGSANIGLGISGKQAEVTRPVQHLKAFCSKYFPSGIVVRRTIGGVPCSGGIKKLIADGLMVCGDAGHMANPITGGGIINSMLAGQFAGETASDALKKGKTDERTLASYEKRCNDSFGKMNRRFYRIKNGILTIPDDRLNDIAREILALPISKRTPVRVLTSALKHSPSLIPLLAKIIL
jgi:digeranylgeranylglycerophospholipid reductase